MSTPLTDDEVEAWNARRWERLTPIERLEDAMEILWLAMTPIERYAMSRKAPNLMGPWERGQRRDGKGPTNGWERHASKTHDNINVFFFDGTWCWFVWYGGPGQCLRSEDGRADSFIEAATAAEAFWRKEMQCPTADEPTEFVGGFPEDTTLNVEPWASGT